MSDCTPIAPIRSPDKTRLRNKTGRGSFIDGRWRCECDPRLEANLRLVRKKNANLGRLFYTCPRPQDEACDFFLWHDDAKLREPEQESEGGRQHSSPDLRANSEAIHAWQRQQHQEEQQRAQTSRPAKRSIAAIVFYDDSTDSEADHDESHTWPSTPSVSGEPQTPRKSTKTSTYATPSTSRIRRLTWPDNSAEDHQPPTPSRPPGSSSTEAESPPPAAITPAAPQPALPTPPETHPQVLVKAEPAAASPAPATQDLMSNVLALLARHGAALPAATEGPLRSLLNDQEMRLTKAEMRLAGAVRGRDFVRATVQDRDARIVELQARIAGVEAERDVFRRQLLGTGATGRSERGERMTGFGTGTGAGGC